MRDRGEYLGGALCRKAKEPALFRIHDKPTTEAIYFSIPLRTGGAGVGRCRAEINRNRAIMPNCEIDCRQAGRRNAANYAAAFNEAGDLRSGKPRALAGGVAVLCAHFTSPIRRYPDLSLHRAIKYLLAKSKGRATPQKRAVITTRWKRCCSSANFCSMAERRADEATRDVSDWLKCDFMLDQVGNVFKGVIASVTGFGFFVVLMNAVYRWARGTRFLTG